MTNLLRALLNIKEYGNNDLKKIVVVTNPNQPRINKEGEALDAFIKDSFCNAFQIKNPIEKMKLYAEKFSYLGSQNHPPDIIIKNSDAIEVKKVSSVAAKEIQLNSSTPKFKLKSDSFLLTKECIECENGWREKDMIYAVGHVESNKLRVLTFVYGDCYAADSDYYENIRKEIISGILKLNFPFSETNELGRINGVDPLKRTNMRIRGMWIIKSPLNVFSQIMKLNKTKSELSVFAIMRKEKFESFPPKDKEDANNRLILGEITIKDPNDPKKNVEAKLISFNF